MLELKGNTILDAIYPVHLIQAIRQNAADCCTCAEVFLAVCQVNRCHGMMDVLPQPSRYLPESRRKRRELYC